MKKLIVIVTLLFLGSFIVIVLAQGRGEASLHKHCKRLYGSAGERTGCLLGAYSEQHKLRRSCAILTACAVAPDSNSCLRKRIGAVVRELSERSHSRPFVSFTRQLMEHMERVVKTHPIRIVNACRAGRNILRSEAKPKEHVVQYRRISAPIPIKERSQ